jgi:antitoxin component of RelBE/YafQ-DinJ toxin-antitoxin module
VKFDGHLHIRIDQKQHKLFLKVCNAADVDASAVIRSLMQQVTKNGIAFDPDTGNPTIREGE